MVVTMETFDDLEQAKAHATEMSTYSRHAPVVVRDAEATNIVCAVEWRRRRRDLGRPLPSRPTALSLRFNGHQRIPGTSGCR